MDSVAFLQPCPLPTAAERGKIEGFEAPLQIGAGRGEVKRHGDLQIEMHPALARGIAQIAELVYSDGKTVHASSILKLSFSSRRPTGSAVEQPVPIRFLKYREVKNVVHQKWTKWLLIAVL